MEKQEEKQQQGRCSACGCVGPNPGYIPLSSLEVMRRLVEISPYWKFETKEEDDSQRLVRKFTCRNWQAAIDYIQAASVVAESEEIQHHPDIHLTRYRDIEVSLMTHFAKGLTDYDFALAKKLDTIVADYSPKWLKANPEPLRLSAVVAVTPTWGIGKDGGLPWTAQGVHLKKDLSYFKRMTMQTVDPNKVNVVLMGRRTWEGIPEQNRPLKGRVNVVLSKNKEWSPPEDSGVLKAESLADALHMLSELPLLIGKIEKVVVIGGAALFEETFFHPQCSEYHVTHLEQDFASDTFLTPRTQLALSSFLMAGEGEELSGPLEGDGVRYRMMCYNPHLSSELIGASSCYEEEAPSGSAAKKAGSDEVDEYSKESLARTFFP